ncbi:hypothetical protein ABK040_008197 [Willaertia magna]
MKSGLRIRNSTQSDMYLSTPKKQITDKLPKHTPTPKKMVNTSLLSPNSKTRRKVTETCDIQVYLRIKPIVSDIGTCVKVVDEKTIEFNSQKSNDKYTFSKVFDSTANQKDVYEITSKPLLQKMFDGKDSLLFSYGVTGSGKTYTMLGKSQQQQVDLRKSTIATGITSFDNEDRGVIPRLLEDLFSMISAQKENDVHYEVFSTFVEVYDGKVNDLLHNYADGDFRESLTSNFSVASSTSSINSILSSSSSSSNSSTKNKGDVEVREFNGKFILQGAKEVTITDCHKGKSILLHGNKCRSIRATQSNADSSRSHAIFTISLIKRDEELNQKEIGKITVVDLAGSERQKNTGAENKALKEASTINNSLMNLSRCMRAMKENQEKGVQTHIPYRDDVLTKILFKNEFLQGNGQVVMILNITPAAEGSNETVMALSFSGVVKEVKLKANDTSSLRRFLQSPKSVKKPVVSVGMVTDEDEELEELKRCYNRLKQEIEVVKMEVRQSTELEMRKQLTEEFEFQMNRVEELHQLSIIEMQKSMYQTIENNQQNIINQLNHYIQLYRETKEELERAQMLLSIHSQEENDKENGELMIERMKQEIEDLNEKIIDYEQLSKENTLLKSQYDELSVKYNQLVDNNNQKNEMYIDYEKRIKEFEKQHKEELANKTKDFKVETQLMKAEYDDKLHNQEKEIAVLRTKLEKAIEKKEQWKKYTTTLKEKYKQLSELNKQEKKEQANTSLLNKFKSIFVSSQHEDKDLPTFTITEDSISPVKKRKTSLEVTTDSPSKKQKNSEIVVHDEEEEEEVTTKQKSRQKSRRRKKNSNK